MLTSALPVISRAASTAWSRHTAYSDNPQSRCLLVGLRQLMTNSCTPLSCIHLIRLLSGDRSMA
ncbi:hypothetical protein D3C84_1140650 [compost metagenome]